MSSQVIQRTMEARLLTMLAETPVHAGSGAELGAVDLPIQRERHTRYPTIHGSGIKGVLRDLSERLNGDGQSSITCALFGSPPPEEAGGEALEAGSLLVSDARLVLLPVRSAGTPFIWATCPFILQRLERDLRTLGGEEPKKLADHLANGLQNMDRSKGAVPSRFPTEAALLEEIRVEVDKGKADPIVACIKELFPAGESLAYWRERLEDALVVVGDDVFADLALHGTEIVTRVRLTEEKTVKEGALWTEEYLPADSFLYSMLCLEIRRLGRAWERKQKGNGAPQGWLWVQDLVQHNPVVQFGGKETIGRGFMRLHLWPN